MSPSQAGILYCLSSHRYSFSPYDGWIDRWWTSVWRGWQAVGTHLPPPSARGSSRFNRVWGSFSRRSRAFRPAWVILPWTRFRRLALIKLEFSFYSRRSYWIPASLNILSLTMPPPRIFFSTPSRRSFFLGKHITPVRWPVTGMIDSF